MNDNSGLYRTAQIAIAELKATVYELLERSPDGLANAEIGRQLGIYMGHVGHEGHVSRTVLSLMEHEGSVQQAGKRGKWHIGLKSPAHDIE